MFLIGDFLEKFKKIQSDRVVNYKSILSIINNQIGSSLTNKDIVVDRRILHIKASAIIKTEVYIKKDNLLKLLKEYNIDSIV